MSTSASSPAAKRPRDPRVLALRNFAISISIFNIAGYTVLGFEQSWGWPLIALAVSYTLDLTLEVIGARGEKRPPRFLGNGVRGLVEYLYPAHITALAVNMLLYVNDRIPVMVFGVMVAISGKWILRVPVRGRLRHYMNPSNLGITVVVLLFSWTSIAPPYHFTEGVGGIVDWLIPLGILGAGSMLNGMLTKRMWLIGAWVIGFALQAIVRGLIFDTSIVSALSMMTGVAFILFTNYMIPDPGTTPMRPVSQVGFGAGAALVYGLLIAVHVPYGLIFSLTITCAIRGGFLWALHIVRLAQQRHEEELKRKASDGVAPADGARSNGSGVLGDKEVVRT